MALNDLPHSPAADRNKMHILAVLRQVLPARASVLEIAAGTGQHAAYFAAEEMGWQWQPTDADERGLPFIAERCAGLPNLLTPLQLDVLTSPWPVPPARFDAIYCANMLHISPWPTCAALMNGVAHALEPNGVLLIYGPFIVDDEPTAPSNAAFDASLNARNPEWGLRRLADVVAEASAAGLRFEERVAMPSNNLMLLFRQS